MLVAQNGAAQQCLLDDPLTPNPTCGDAATEKAAPYGPSTRTALSPNAELNTEPQTLDTQHKSIHTTH